MDWLTAVVPASTAVPTAPLLQQPVGVPMVPWVNAIEVVGERELSPTCGLAIAAPIMPAMNTENAARRNTPALTVLLVFRF
jgi:hypothetical protein